MRIPLILALISGCAAKSPNLKTIHAVIQGEPIDARVSVDDRIVGSLDIVMARGVGLPVGRHRISVEREGFFPCDKLVDVHETDSRVAIECKLIPIPE